MKKMFLLASCIFVSCFSLSSCNNEEPTVEPTVQPTAEPTVESTIEPTVDPTIEPTIQPTIEPTVEPTIEQTVAPTVEPTIVPSEPEPTVEPSVDVSYVENDVVEIPLDLPYIEMSKTIYKQTDTIKVNVFDAGKTDWVGIYGVNEEPGWNTSLVWEYVNNKDVLEFSASSLPKNQQFFSVYLCHDGGYDVFDKIDIVVKENDNKDYGILQAQANVSDINGIKKSSIIITPSTDKEVTYELRWAVEEFTLDDYTYIKRFKKASTEPFEVVLNDTMYMPEIADSIEVSVIEGRSTPYYVYLDDTLKLPKSNYRFSFEVLTDIHIENYGSFPNHVSHLKAALRDINSIANNSKAIFTVGDNTNHGYDENYRILMEILESERTQNTPNIYFSLGNHEYMYGSLHSESLKAFINYTKMPNHYYSVEIEGIKYIVLGSDSKVMSGTISDEQYNWFVSELESVDKNKPTFIFAHQPLKDTVSGSLYSKDSSIQYWYGLDKGEQIKELLKGYPNAVLFSGHTHWNLDSYQPILFGNLQGASYVNCSSVGYLWNDNDQQEPGSEGIFVEVYEDYILVKGREFVDRKWIATAQFVFPLKK